MARYKRYKGKYYSPKRRRVYAQGDDIDHLTLFNLRGWVCYDCGEPVDPKRRFPDPMAATVEHIIPISKGGTHTWDNCDMAHAKCNWLRGNSYDTGLDTATAMC